MAATEIEPKSTATLTINVKDDTGANIAGATVTLTLIGPDGVTPITGAIAQPMTDAGAGNYTLVLLPAWTTDTQGNGVTGRYLLETTATKNGLTRVDRIPLLVVWNA